MQRVGKFEKVSYEQFATAVNAMLADNSYAPLDKSMMDVVYDGLQLPERATEGSAGYDFKAPFNISLAPGETVKVPTGIRVKIDNGWWLGCLPRSSLGFKYHLQLANTLGVIDSDYYNADNEGHIFFKLTNDGTKPLQIEAGNAFVQGVFIPYGITYADEATEKRTGGMGSSGA